MLILWLLCHIILEVLTIIFEEPTVSIFRVRVLRSLRSELCRKSGVSDPGNRRIVLSELRDGGSPEFASREGEIRGLGCRRCPSAPSAYHSNFVFTNFNTYTL
jgi:hypothetical protein